MVRTGWLDDHLLKRCSALHACSGSPLLERTLCPFLPSEAAQACLSMAHA